GGGGNDTYVVDSAGDLITENADEGIDTVVSSVDWTLGANLENLSLNGAAIQAIGNELDNAILGNALANVLNGGGGNDILDGAAGADAMDGGAGDDSYVVDNAGDTAAEAADGGTDTVFAAVDYSLGANIENLVLTNGAVQGAGNALDNHITGNALANVLSGDAGDDVLDGGDGADQLIGGTGDDTYVLGVGDSIVEGADEGVDTVASSESASLAGFNNVENLVLTGSANINGTGNALDNLLEGNAGNNLLSGGGGSDTLEGGEGNDTLDGGDGNDVLAGGQGNDVYRIAAGDVIQESADGGIDTIESGFSFDLATTPDVENLRLVVNGDMFAYGNDLDNVITGNGSRNEILGRGGDDRLVGQGGRDTIDGGTGDDRIQGGGARDVLTGGEGEDNFVFSNLSANDSDQITDFNAEEDMITLDRSVFTNVGSGPLDGDMFHAGSGAGAVAQNADHRIIFDTSTGILYYDADGAGGAAQVEFAIVNVVNGTLADENFVAAF
ncbi:MAG TPA: calcium-binding protein, partial [Burkholderiales bacterium]|nr:calcium-binding protein [Burkholderiales bacterium]